MVKNKKYIGPDNMYYTIRAEKGLSRDKACNLFEGISPDRLERIENGKVLPNPEEVMELAEKYRNPSLRNYYCSHQCPMGKWFVPQTREMDLSQAVLQLVANLNRLSEMKNNLIEITANGDVSKESKDSFEIIIKELEQLKSTIDSMLLWREKRDIE